MTSRRGSNKHRVHANKFLGFCVSSSDVFRGAVCVAAGVRRCAERTVSGNLNKRGNLPRNDACIARRLSSKRVTIHSTVGSCLTGTLRPSRKMAGAPIRSLTVVVMCVWGSDTCAYERVRKRTREWERSNEKYVRVPERE